MSRENKLNRKSMPGWVLVSAALHAAALSAALYFLVPKPQEEYITIDTITMEEDGKGVGLYGTNGAFGDDKKGGGKDGPDERGSGVSPLEVISNKPPQYRQKKAKSIASGVYSHKPIEGTGLLDVKKDSNVAAGSPGKRSLFMRDLAPRQQDIVPDAPKKKPDLAIKSLDGIVKQQSAVVTKTPDHVIHEYADGGRTVQNISGRDVSFPERPSYPRSMGNIGAPPIVLGNGGPGIPEGTPGTLDGIADIGIPGAGKGSAACDFYKKYPSPTKKRNLYLMVDTSGSMQHKLNSAQVCAAGAAKSALKAGIPVAVINFSDISYYQPPTLDMQKIRDAIAINIGGGTMVPELIIRGLEDPTDFVIVSDGGFNLFNKRSFDIHRFALAGNRYNRAAFYLIADAAMSDEYNNPDSPYNYLKKLGYKEDNIGKIRF